MAAINRLKFFIMNHDIDILEREKELLTESCSLTEKMDKDNHKLTKKVEELEELNEKLREQLTQTLEMLSIMAGQRQELKEELRITNNYWESKEKGEEGSDEDVCCDECGSCLNSQAECDHPKCVLNQ